MPISSATEAAMRDRTGATPRSRVIPLGVNPLAEPGDDAVDGFARRAKLLPEDRVVLTVGRLVARKGVAWFAGNVLPRLGRDAVYVVVGEGPEHEAILRAAGAAGVGDRLRMLGRVDGGLLAGAYRRADVFVMPNIPVPGDMEGFGLVALEAAAADVPVVAADLEGIIDAVQHGRNGMRCRPRDAGAFASAVTDLLDLSEDRRRALGARFGEFTRSEYSWSNTAERYARAIEGLVAPSVVRIAA